MAKFHVAFAIAAQAVAALILAGCGPGESASPGSSEAKRSTAEETEPIDSAWVTDEEKATWQETHDAEGTWVVGFFLLPGSECSKTGPGDPIRRFHLLSEGERALAREELLGEAFTALEGSAPADLSNPLEAVPLKPLNARVEGDTVYLDFASGIYATNGTGTCGGSAMQVQLLALVNYYFPEARDVCVLVEGIRSGQDGEALVFHDSAACPLPLRG
jgi:hypothetical protein